MTLSEASKLLGTALWNTGGEQALFFEVQVVDVREVFGRVDVQITPVNGIGTRWVSMDTVRYPDRAVA